MDYEGLVWISWIIIDYHILYHYNLSIYLSTIYIYIHTIICPGTLHQQGLLHHSRLKQRDRNTTCEEDQMTCSLRQTLTGSRLKLE